MALNTTVVWEVRPATGSDTNGGGFDPSVTSPGTDYSQQGSPQYSFTDGVTVGTATFTSVSHSFVSVDVGNIICISAGSGNTAGFYTVVSVAGGTATLDRSPGTGTGATWKLGGALATVGILFNRSPGSGYNPNSTYGGTIYMKGTQSLTSSTYIQPRFGGPGDFTLIGYGTTRGDNVQAVFTINATNYCWEFANTNGRFYNIAFTTTAGTPSAAVACTSGESGYWLFDNCSFNGFTYALTGSNSYDTVLINCLIENCTNSSEGGIYIGTGNLLCIGCYFKNNAGAGYNINVSSPASATFIGCVFNGNKYGIYNQGDGQINAVVMVSVIKCAFYGQTSDGIRDFGGGTNYPQVLSIVNSIFYGNTGYGINCKTVSPITYAAGRNNAFGSNTAGNYVGWPGTPGDVTLTANPFTAPASDNFILNSTAGGGAACIAAGFESTLI